MASKYEVHKNWPYDLVQSVERWFATRLDSRGPASYHHTSLHSTPCIFVTLFLSLYTTLIFRFLPVGYQYSGSMDTVIHLVYYILDDVEVSFLPELLVCSYYK
jgi:hypothetical protein